MKVNRKRYHKTVGIDLSPMLDVIFQLILFFLVSTTFATLPGIKLNLPVSTTSQGTDASGITITVDENENIYFNDKNILLENLGENLLLLDTGKIEKENYPVTLSADSKVTSGTIVKIFDELRKVGFSSVSLRTKNIGDWGSRNHLKRS